MVFVTNDNKPDFLRDFPDADGPYLQVITHPTNPYVKLLLVQGRDSQDLNTAVQGLALVPSCYRANGEESIRCFRSNSASLMTRPTGLIPQGPCVHRASGTA